MAWRTCETHRLNIARSPLQIMMGKTIITKIPAIRPNPHLHFGSGYRTFREQKQGNFSRGGL